MNAADMHVSFEPDLRATSNMINTAAKILNTKIVIDPYESLSQPESSPEDKESIDKLNQLMKLLTPFINTQKEPDLKFLEKKTGFDESTIKDIMAQLTDTINRVKR